MFYTLNQINLQKFRKMDGGIKKKLLIHTWIMTILLNVLMEVLPVPCGQH